MLHQDTLQKKKEILPRNKRNPKLSKRTGRARQHWALAAAIFLAVIGLALIAVLHFGGYALVHTDPLPKHADVAIVLDGGEVGLRARTAEGVRLLQNGIVGNLLISLPPKNYWGKSVPRQAASYFKGRYGKQVMLRTAFCISDADSTIEEAGALQWCLETAEWRKVIVVTSNYHTRRAGNVWRSALAGARPPFKLWVDGVQDGSFQPRGWWRSRIYAKTWLFEATKLAWESVFGDGPWKHAPVKAELYNPASARHPDIKTPSP